MNKADGKDTGSMTRNPVRFYAIVFTLTAVILSGCAVSTPAQVTVEPPGSKAGEAAVSAVQMEYQAKDVDSEWVSDTPTHIDLAGSCVRVSGPGAAANGSTVTITAEGVYVLSGTWENGQIIVEAEKKQDLQLVLNGVEIHCGDSARHQRRQARHLCRG